MLVFYVHKKLNQRKLNKNYYLLFFNKNILFKNKPVKLKPNNIGITCSINEYKMPKDSRLSGVAYPIKKKNTTDSLNPKPKIVMGMLLTRIINGTHTKMA